MYQNAGFGVYLAITFPHLDRTHVDVGISRHLFADVVRYRSASRSAPENQLAVRHCERVEGVHQVMETLPWFQQSDKADAEVRRPKSRLRKLRNVDLGPQHHHVVEASIQKCLASVFGQDSDQIRALVLNQGAPPDGLRGSRPDVEFG